MAKVRGLDIKMDWKPDEQGQIMAHVRIKRWYMPLFIMKALRMNHIPLRFWPLVYRRHYTGYAKKQVT